MSVGDMLHDECGSVKLLLSFVCFLLLLNGAAGNGRVTQIGFRVHGIPPEQTVNRTGAFPAFGDPFYWANVVLAAHDKFTMLAAWQTYPEPEPDDPEGDD